MFLNNDNSSEAREYFDQIIDLGIHFKLQKSVAKWPYDLDQEVKNTTLPQKGESLEDILVEFKESILPYCTNFSSSNFMGFPDAGNSVAALSGSILSDFLQQNLINQSTCSPSATFVEISVIQWLRETVGYSSSTPINDIWDAGGIITPGGTMSNTIGLLLARENKFPNAMKEGIEDFDRSWLIVPQGIGHYSVKSAQMWTGGGHRMIEVKTNNFRYDLAELEKVLKKHRGKVMCLVAYAGDSRTMTVDNFGAIHNLVSKIDPSIWLHADACHGFSMGLSTKHRKKIRGIEKFDSITMDPHKVLNTPYVISALLVREPPEFKKITSLSDLIMQEEFAFGQITPFLGSRPWNSLKLWFLMKNLGKTGLEELINNRHERALYLYEKLKYDEDFLVCNKPEINSVMFFYIANISSNDIENINNTSKRIHKVLLREGVYHLHQFSIPDPGILKQGVNLYPLRFMSGNPNLTNKEMDEMVEYVRHVGSNINSYD